MTDNAETPAQAAESAPEATEPDPGTEPTPEGENPEETLEADEAKPGREAAKYRRQAREAQTERDKAIEELGLTRARLDHMQTLEAQRHAAELLADPADLWRDGLTLDQLLDSDGNLDPNKVTTAARTAIQAHPHWRRKTRPATLDGQRSGATNQHTGIKVGWRDALNPAN